MQGLVRALHSTWGDETGDGNAAKGCTQIIHTLLAAPLGAAQEGSHPERSCAMQRRRDLLV